MDLRATVGWICNVSTYDIGVEISVARHYGNKTTCQQIISQTMHSIVCAAIKDWREDIIQIETWKPSQYIDEGFEPPPCLMDLANIKKRTLYDVTITASNTGYNNKIKKGLKAEQIICIVFDVWGKGDSFLWHDLHETVLLANREIIEKRLLEIQTRIHSAGINYEGDLDHFDPLPDPWNTVRADIWTFFEKPEVCMEEMRRGLTGTGKLQPVRWKREEFEMVSVKINQFIHPDLEPMEQEKLDYKLSKVGRHIQEGRNSFYKWALKGQQVKDLLVMAREAPTDKEFIQAPMEGMASAIGDGYVFRQMDKPPGKFRQKDSKMPVKYKNQENGKYILAKAYERWRERMLTRLDYSCQPNPIETSASEVNTLGRELWNDLDFLMLNHHYMAMQRFASTIVKMSSIGRKQSGGNEGLIGTLRVGGKAWFRYIIPRQRVAKVKDAQNARYVQIGIFNVDVLKHDRKCLNGWDLFSIIGETEQVIGVRTTSTPLAHIAYFLNSRQKKINLMSYVEKVAMAQPNRVDWVESIRSTIANKQKLLNTLFFIDWVKMTQNDLPSQDLTSVCALIANSLSMRDRGQLMSRDPAELITKAQKQLGKSLMGNFFYYLSVKSKLFESILTSSNGKGPAPLETNMVPYLEWLESLCEEVDDEFRDDLDTEMPWQSDPPRALSQLPAFAAIDLQLWTENGPVPWK